MFRQLQECHASPDQKFANLEIGWPCERIVVLRREIWSRMYCGAINAFRMATKTGLRVARRGDSADEITLT